jgi:hypothetical protein
LAPTICIDCGRVSNARRCPACQRALERRKRQARPGYSYAERLRRARLVEQHIAAYGLVCPGCPYNQGRPHPVDPRTNPLTADHVTPVADAIRAGIPADVAEAGPLRVMCRKGNSARVNKGKHR